ncbi:DUF3857 domain-containing protein [Hymenobacter cellulosivorans]|uniref:DUF3857 domain-containing protein n=1 Tax=Hymenobacter cellulosivorans TaxID=2932249 RepID=A0ABY4F9D2_9BACT|nr:DUF3857 domain-containing protein [Hymenobacter cellulosivorans]UOQ53274.1 DUF3857 domain-containing protein [Hymenobacter cellulosivorans]
MLKSSSRLFWLTLALGWLTVLDICAQAVPAGLTHAGYSWDAKRKRLPLTEAETQLPALLLLDFTAQEYFYDEKTKKLGLYSTSHSIVRVNSTDAIERFNKIYVPVQDGALLWLKARTISPRGEVVELNQSNIKELKDQDGGRGFKIFAVEGVEKGSEIEYVYMRQRSPNYFGREYLQSDLPARSVTFELISPEQLTFDTRVYHGPQASRDTVIGGKHIVRMVLKDVAQTREEAFANPQAERMRIEYKLAYNASRGRERLFTWAKASQYIHGTLYGYSKDEQKALDKLLKQMKVPAGDVAEQVQFVENYLKTNFNPAEGYVEPELSSIINTRNATDLGFARLFGGVFRKLGIEHEVVVTSDRSVSPFDESFDTWNYLDNYIFYFPATKQMLAPARSDYRYGMVPSEWTANPGLFIRTVKLGATESAVGKVKDIPTLTADQNPSDLDIKVQFAPALDKSTVNIRYILGGYNAQVIQPFYSLIPEEKRTEIAQGFIKSCVPDATFKSLNVINGERGLSPLAKPFIVEAGVESAALLNRAGPKYLFKVGELLGPQSELYQADARQFDVENEFNRRYNRVITFELPAGYNVRNLKDLNYNVKAGPDAAAPLYLFQSSYAVEGQKVTVTIKEHYQQIRWPKKDFEAFREVVNAAANFNKVVLVLEKKG